MTDVGALAGIRVVDLTNNVAGPFATQVLGDLGADVTKVERPGTGDDTRGWGPPFWPGTDVSVTFAALNRNKRSVALDLKSPAHAKVLDGLIAEADILIENMRPRAFSRLGYSAERLSELNDSLIYCKITGFGQDGDRADEPAYDPLIQAYSGLMSLTGDSAGPPCRIPVSILDQGSALWAVIAILNALRLRDSGHRGLIEVHTSLLETALQLEPNALLGYLATGVVPQRLGSAAAMISPYQAFPTADDYIVVAAGNDRLWQRLCAALRRPDLQADERFVTNAGRVRCRAELERELSASFATQSAQTWLAVLTAAGIPSSKINTIDQVAADPQVKAVGAITRHGQDETGPVYLRLPITTNGERFQIRMTPPALGNGGG